jgi:hypothetical protein
LRAERARPVPRHAEQQLSGLRHWSHISLDDWLWTLHQ